MYSHDLEHKINEKADKWELHNVQNENRQLQNKINELERRIGNLESQNSNHNNIIGSLLNLLAYNESLHEISNELHTLRCNF